MTPEDFDRLIEAGILGEVGLRDGRLTCGDFELMPSGKQIAAAAELGIDLGLHLKPAACLHLGYRLTYRADPGGPHGSHTMGAETCDACGSSRRVEGDHAGPWCPPGTEPTWDVPAGAEHERPETAPTPGLALAELVVRLASVMDLNDVPAWLLTPLDALHGAKPIALVAGGPDGLERVRTLVSALEEPGAI